MGFTTFYEGNPRGNTTVGISTNGVMWLNDNVMKYFNRNKKVILLHDIDNKKIGIKEASSNDPCQYKISIHGKGSSLHISSLLKHFKKNGIEYNHNIRCQTNWNASSNMLEVLLP